MPRLPEISAPVATDLIVFGRGLEVGPQGDVVALSPASQARVYAVLAHVAEHAELFTARRQAGRRGRVVFSGGWAGAADGLPAPDERFREAHLMRELATATAGAIATAIGVGGTDLAALVDVFAEIESDSTLENALRVREGGWFADRTFGPAEPLGLVAHAGHMDRVDYFTRKAFRLPRRAVQHIVAPGDDTVSGGRSEASLYRMTRLACLGAVTPAALRRRERLMRAGFRLLPDSQRS